MTEHLHINISDDPQIHIMCTVGQILTTPKTILKMCIITCPKYNNCNTSVRYFKQKLLSSIPFGLASITNTFCTGSFPRRRFLMKMVVTVPFALRFVMHLMINSMLSLASSKNSLTSAPILDASIKQGTS